MRTLILMTAVAAMACGADPVDEAIDLQRRGIARQCACRASVDPSVDAAACRREGESDLPDASEIECFRATFDAEASATDEEITDCQLNATDRFVSCYERAGCTDSLAIEACQATFESEASRCGTISARLQNALSICDEDDGAP